MARGEGTNRRASDLRELLLEGLTAGQSRAVQSPKRGLLVVAGAGSGKTEVMARRVAWWVAVDEVRKDSIIAFTFTERAAEEMKFRIRHHIQRVTPVSGDATLAGMYVGTIHGFCLKLLRELRPDVYHNFDVLDEAARYGLVQRGYHHLLGLSGFASAIGAGQYAAIDRFLEAYDLLNEYDELNVKLASPSPPDDFRVEGDWCKGAVLRTSVGKSKMAKAFAVSAARYYAYLRSRRFLDFSTSQSELLRLLREDRRLLEDVRTKLTHLVVDEVQDINQVQDQLIRMIVGDNGRLTAVGDHRQAIYGWRGGRVEIMARLYGEMKRNSDGGIVDLKENFRSTPRIIEVSNRWARTIGAVQTMTSPSMRHGRKGRIDLHSTHTSALTFKSREEEADWIARSIEKLVHKAGEGAFQDSSNGEPRGISYSDIAVLVRTSTDAKTYMAALERCDIPAVVRAGPDLFSQPEVLLFVAALGRAAGIEEFYGGKWWNSLPSRIAGALGCAPKPEPVIRAACAALRRAGLPLADDVEQRLLLASMLMSKRISGETVTPTQAGRLRTPALIEWLKKTEPLRRVFPQTLFHFLVAEAGIGDWDSTGGGRAQAAMYHLGQFSTQVKGIETPGWNAPRNFKYEVIALYMHGSQAGRTEEAPLLVQPDAVTVTTIHSAKGLEYAVIFLADVVRPRFPNSRAKQVPKLPFDGTILKRLNPSGLADNANYDNERRLMYVALTRAERYLFVTSTREKRSEFFKTIEREIVKGGGAVGSPRRVPTGLHYQKSEPPRELRLATSFSDMRYYLECPHDFYLRKVLGFAPTIDQAFGYGRGIHNLLREVHIDPKAWAQLARDPAKLRTKVRELIERGLFYLRYTIGDPLDRMRRKAVEVVAEYVAGYAEELARLTFEPERPFETLIEEEQVLVSGAIDVVRLDDPPRVSLIDFKSGEPDSDGASLDQEEMRLQVTLYGLAAKHELEYDPDLGMVRYLGETDPAKRQVTVELTNTALEEARKVVVKMAGSIRRREFDSGPRLKSRKPEHRIRCEGCDFILFCGREEAKQVRNSRTSPS